MANPNSRILLFGRTEKWPRPYVELLERAGYQVRGELIENGFKTPLLVFDPHLIILELLKPETNRRPSGSDPIWQALLQEARSTHPFRPLIVFVTMETLSEAIEAIRFGAEDFLVEPVSPETLLLRIEKALKNQQLREKVETLSREIRFHRNQDSIVGASQKMQALLQLIVKVAVTDATVLITGETGSGKELVARAIHYNSKRAGHPFIIFNCSAIPEGLMEDQLFGHVRGAFSGADSETRGIFEQAHSGTLFLDEIGDLPDPLQAKLLRVLESGEFQKIGGEKSIQTHARILASTQKDLSEESQNGRFREDLFYRLNVFPISVPPLRERQNDIPLLVQHFFDLYREGLNKKLEGFSPSAIQKLVFYPWPGNVRELDNRVRQSMISASGTRVYREDILFEDVDKDRPFKSFREAKQEFEMNYIMNVLRLSGGNVAKAARLARKDRKDFYGVIRRYGIRSKDFRVS